MANIQITLPAMGEGIIEATITRWLVSEGDRVEEDQPIVEIATDKVDTELPSPVPGVVSKILAAEGDNIRIGAVIAVIESDNKSGKAGPEDRSAVLPGISDKEEHEREPQSENADRHSPGEDHAFAGTSGQPQTGRLPNHTPSGKFITPLVRNIAEKEQVTLQELETVTGTGESGRITRNDILKYLGTRGEATSDDRVKNTEAEGDRIISMDRMRRLIAENMVASKKVSPHVTSFIDADVTELVHWRESVKARFFDREKQKITYTPVFIEAVARALRDYPMVNVSVDGTDIIVRKNVNIGMAVALPEGNLIVPVIRNADEKNLIGLVKAVNDLANRARNKKLQPSEVTGGTFTITNFGTFRNTTGTPIINQPEAAILGAGAITKKPVVIETEKGDVIAIRHIMTLSLSYDHRVIDGALGGMFLDRIARYLENFDITREL